MADDSKPKRMLGEPVGDKPGSIPEGVRVDPKAHPGADFGFDDLKRIVQAIHQNEPEKFADLYRFMNQLLLLSSPDIDLIKGFTRNLREVQDETPGAIDALRRMIKELPKKPWEKRSQSQLNSRVKSSR